MPNIHHFEILKQGVESWNEWYAANPDLIADLSGLCLSGFDLSGFVLTGANLTDVEFRSADLTRADLRGAVLTGAILHAATLDGADLRLATGLTEAALAGTIGNTATQLPANLERPAHWVQSPALVYENAELVRELFAGRQPSRVGG